MPTLGAGPADAAPPQPEAADRIGELLRLATEHESAGRFGAAETILRDILAEAPGNHAALHLMGIVAFRQDRLDEGARLMEQSIALMPTMALYHRNICEVYRVLRRQDEALVAGRRAASLAPNDPHCHHNLGVLHYHRLELAEAIAAAERALAIDPNFAGAHFGIAEASLLRGDFPRGWEEYEWRFKLASAPPLMPPTEKPLWDGAPLGDAILLLIADQGYGDVIQFCRYIPWAAGRCPRIVLACSTEMHGVMRQMPGIEQLISHWDRRPDFAAYCSLSGLPRLAGTTQATIPDTTPYLRADATAAANWADRLATLLPRDYFRIGIAWAGRPTHHNDRNRSTALATFAPLADLPRVALVSLQKGAGQSQIGSYWGRAPLLNLGPELRDYGDTMAVVENLDLLVTVDTSVLHLAGAMGKPAWVMLPYAPDWRWLLDREDSPWYATLRLFRQSAAREWPEVMTRIAAEVMALLPGT